MMVYMGCSSPSIMQPVYRIYQKTNFLTEGARLKPCQNTNVSARITIMHFPVLYWQIQISDISIMMNFFFRYLSYFMTCPCLPPFGAKLPVRPSTLLLSALPLLHTAAFQRGSLHRFTYVKWSDTPFFLADFGRHFGIDSRHHSQRDHLPAPAPSP